jgi:hypothetical protein
VKEMQRVVESTGQTLPQLWLEVQSEIVSQAREIEKVETGGVRKPVEKLYVKLNEVSEYWVVLLF